MATAAKKTPRPTLSKNSTSTIKSAFTDAVATAVFVFASSVFGEVNYLVFVRALWFKVHGIITNAWGIHVAP
jgi:hypothetical protein